ncbi:hypothetical protein [Streptomyces sp. LaPpAH-108]|uniref:hypothetical protein n=1 Tax=Streptomyces sp. LaPpAH-108 TaxID=1155714 RepID=UPI00037E005E|nr:hypothetical protein [Streptomyces sp. LaPpAH-108]
MFTRRRRRTVQEGPYWKQRGWQMSAGFLAAVVVLAGIVALTSGGDDGAGHTEAAASGGPPTGGTLTSDGRPPGCHTDEAPGNTVPATAPHDVSWRAIGVVRVPVSAAAGPTVTDRAPWWCFAHTPVGSVLAAQVITSQMSEAHWRTVADRQLVPGRGRDRFVFHRSTVGSTGTERRPDSASVSSYAGFAVTRYDGKDSTVDLLIKSSQGYAATSIDLRWSGGDWKVVPSGDGSLHSPVRSVQNANGYVVWGGTRA